MLWTTKEEQDLIFELKNDNTLSVIAQKHNRSENAIKLRLASMIQRELDKGISRKKILSTFNITEEMMKNLLDLSKRFSSSSHSSSSVSESSSSTLNLILEKMEDMNTKLSTLEKYVKTIYKKVSNK